MKPVAVIADVREQGGYVWHSAAQSYLVAVKTVSNAVPFILPSLPDLTEPALDHVSGIVLTGVRTNVHPARYGADETPEHGPFDEARDAVGLNLARAAVRRGLPLLALCRGFQEMNVAWGGALTPALHEEAGRFDHRAPQSDDQDVRFALAHPVTPVPSGRLAAMVGKEAFRVNSLHRQGITRLGEGLQAEAHAPDGTIEAISVTGAAGFTLGVQWHPEYWAATDPPSRAIFKAFGRAVADYRSS